MEDGDGPLENCKRKAATTASIKLRKKQASCLRRVSTLLRRQNGKLLSDEDQIFLKENSVLVDQFYKRKERRTLWMNRQTEHEDSHEELKRKCLQLAQAVHDSEFLVVYTGAGISTAASIPDYRGPDGIWTRLQKGQEIGNHDLSAAKPTLTHMALSDLHHKGIVRHVVSQNCDGLHLRSGLPKTAMSEIHGNMYIEVCKKCEPPREYVRNFDVTEKTSTFKHTTRRRCYRCGEPLIDSIVHFGERGRLRWPLNWQGACQAANACDTILCLGSSLKVLRKYSWLWQMDRPSKRRPQLYIVNLQWTPKDKEATLKINGKCDSVMKLVMEYLGLEISSYCKADDPIFHLATPLHPQEVETTTSPQLSNSLLSDAHLPSDIRLSHTHVSNDVNSENDVEFPINVSPNRQDVQIPRCTSPGKSSSVCVNFPCPNMKNFPSNYCVLHSNCDSNYNSIERKTSGLNRCSGSGSSCSSFDTDSKPELGTGSENANNETSQAIKEEDKYQKSEIKEEIKREIELPDKIKKEFDDTCESKIKVEMDLQNIETNVIPKLSDDKNNIKEEIIDYGPNDVYKHRIEIASFENEIGTRDSPFPASSNNKVSPKLDHFDVKSEFYGTGLCIRSQQKSQDDSSVEYTYSSDEDSRRNSLASSESAADVLEDGTYTDFSENVPSGSVSHSCDDETSKICASALKKNVSPSQIPNDAKVDKSDSLGSDKENEPIFFSFDDNSSFSTFTYSAQGLISNCELDFTKNVIISSNETGNEFVLSNIDDLCSRGIVSFNDYSLISKKKDSEDGVCVINANGGEVCESELKDLNGISKSISADSELFTYRPKMNSSTESDHEKEELKSIWYQSFCCLNEKPETAKSAENEDVKNIWFWGFNTRLEKESHIPETLNREEVGETPKRVTRSSFRDSPSESESPQNSVLIKKKCRCLCLNPKLCLAAALKTEVLHIDSAIQKARNIFRYRRKCNYRRFEPTFEVELESLTYERKKPKRTKLEMYEDEDYDEEEEEDTTPEDTAKEDVPEDASKEDSAPSKEKKIVPGWYGKGYRKLTRRKRTSLF